jgi:hypothetical protein
VSIQQPIPSADIERLDELFTTLGVLLNEARSDAVRGRESVLREIVAFGDALYTPDGFLTYLTTPLDDFGGRSALSLINDGEATRVLEHLAADYDGLRY